MQHELKIHPQFFCRVADGTKTFEVRNNDRGFQPGDSIILREWDPTQVKTEAPNGMFPSCTDSWEEPRGYTGRALIFTAGYIYFLPNGDVVFSLLPDKMPTPKQGELL